MHWLKKLFGNSTDISKFVSLFDTVTRYVGGASHAQQLQEVRTKIEAEVQRAQTAIAGAKKALDQLSSQRKEELDALNKRYSDLMVKPESDLAAAEKQLEAAHKVLKAVQKLETMMR